MNGPDEQGQILYKRVSFKAKKRKFVRPMDYQWICLAAGLPGKAIQVAVGLWHYSGLERATKLGVQFKGSISRISRDMGISRTAATRGLKQLEKVNLVSVERRKGRKTLFRLRDIEKSELRIDSDPSIPPVDTFFENRSGELQSSRSE